MPWPIRRLLTALDVDRLRFEPRTGWAYPNIGYLMVAQLVERITCLTLQRALEKLVFEPAKLETDRLATASPDLGDAQMGSFKNYHPGWVFYGSVVGTVADAASLLRALMTGDILWAGTLAEMLDRRPLP